MVLRGALDVTLKPETLKTTTTMVEVWKHGLGNLT